MGAKDITALIHPAIAITIVFPLIGMVVNFAWQARQRRLQLADGSKSKIPPVVGPDHLKYGKWLSNSVVGLSLIGLAHPIFNTMLKTETWYANPFNVGATILMFIVTLGTLVLLNRAKTKVWRGTFASLTGLGLIVLGYLEVFLDLGVQYPVVFRRESEWMVSHYYYGMVAALLMIFSLAIYPDIYQDRTQRWRKAHVVLNCIALLFFIGQGITGSRDLLEIPLSWQEPYIYSCDFQNLTCPTPTPSPASQGLPLHPENPDYFAQADQHHPMDRAAFAPINGSLR